MNELTLVAKSSPIRKSIYCKSHYLTKLIIYHLSFDNSHINTPNMT